jgi:hypothetical protein
VVAPCLQALPGIFQSGASAFGLNTICHMTPPDGT